MSKYYQAEDVINKVAEYISIDYSREERAREDAELLFADLPSIEVNEQSEHNVHYEIGYEKGKQSKCDGCCQYKIGFEDGKLEMIRMVEDALKKRGGE